MIETERQAELLRILCEDMDALPPGALAADRLAGLVTWVGEMIFATGGMGAMHDAFDAVTDDHPAWVSRIDKLWSGVGEWLA